MAKVIFLQVSVCPQGGGRVSASVHAGMPYPPWMENPPPPQMENPPDGEPPQMENPPDGEPPSLPRLENPPRMENPPGKQTPAYGLRAAGTHPTGMHPCQV